MCLNETHCVNVFKRNIPTGIYGDRIFHKKPPTYFFFKLKRSFAQNYICKGKDKNLPQRNKEYFLLTYVLPLTINWQVILVTKAAKTLKPTTADSLSIKYISYLWNQSVKCWEFVDCFMVRLMPSELIIQPSANLPVWKPIALFCAHEIQI